MHNRIKSVWRNYLILLCVVGRWLLTWTVKISNNNLVVSQWSKITCKVCIQTWEEAPLGNNRWMMLRDNRRFNSTKPWSRTSKIIFRRLVLCKRKFHNNQEVRAKETRKLEILTLKVLSDAQSPTSGSEWSSSTSRLVNSKLKKKRRMLLLLNQLYTPMDRKNLTKMTIKIRKL